MTGAAGHVAGGGALVHSGVEGLNLQFSDSNWIRYEFDWSN